MIELRSVLCSLAAGLLSAMMSLSSSSAQNWPQRPVRFIVSLGAGSGADIGARVFADRLTGRWNQPVVVENRPGADAVLAINTFIGAHDDHTLLYTPTSSFTAHPYQLERMPYDPRQLAPIARVSNTVVVVTVPASLNVSSIGDLVALIR